MQPHHSVTAALLAAPLLLGGGRRRLIAAAQPAATITVLQPGRSAAVSAGTIRSLVPSEAFDTISHKFLSECYQFFNFGPVFTNMLETVGKNRTACILLDNGDVSKSFPLNSGRPQGKNLSPIQYNICNQIFLLKIELDLRIKSTFNKTFGPQLPYPIECNNFGYNRHFSKESNRETDKAEGFADDSSAIVCPDSESIESLEKILEQFTEISGLQCNFGKSSITFINDTPDDLNTKFVVTDSFTLLGVKIDKNLASLQENFYDVRKKIIKIIYFWDRFELSLPGRINIAKTFLVSQINYLGSILLPNDDILNDMQEMIDKFCTKGIRFAKDRLYHHPLGGGAGPN
jgi:hypothetical protein